MTDSKEIAGEGPVLAPDEIAALMAGMGPEEEAQALFASLPPMPQPKNVEKISLEQMAANSPAQSPDFVKLHELLTEALNERWLQPLNEEAAIEMSGMNSETYGEILNSEDHRVYCIFPCGSSGNVMMVLDIPVAVGLIDLMLGGLAKAIDTDISSLSRVEQRLCQRLAKSIGDILGETWQTVSDTSFELSLIETRKDFLEVASDRDPFTSIRYQINLNESLQGKMTIHYPLTMLEPLLETMRSSQEEDLLPDDDWMNRMRLATDQLPLTLRLELGSCRLTIREFLNISTGDIIPLGVAEKEAVKLWVESVPMFLAMPGHRNGALAAEIIKPITETNHE